MALVVALGLPGAARASFSSVPNSLWGTNGRVNAVAVAGNHVFLGGAFSQIGPSTGQGVGLDPSTGTIDQGFAKFVGPVSASVPDGSGGFYVGGSFSSVAGQSRAGIVHLLAGGAVDPSFNAAVSGGQASVSALALSGGVLYVGGDFDHVDGEAHQHVAAVDASTGAVRSEFVANVDGGVQALVATSGVNGRVYVGGSFSTINGVPRSSLAALDPLSGTPVPSFAASVAGSGVAALTVSSGLLYLGGNFYNVDGQSRGNLAAVSLTTGALDGFAPQAGSDYVRAIVVVGPRLFVGGNMTVLPPGAHATLDKLVAFDLSQAGAPLDTAFAPQPDGEVDALSASGTTLYVGGQFTRLAGAFRQRIAALDGDPTHASYGAALAFNPRPDGGVSALAVSGGRLFAGGAFGIVGGINRSNVVALNASDGTADPGFTANTAGGGYTTGEVKSLAVQGTQLYVAGDFGSINSVSKSHLASVSTTDGSVALGFSPAPGDSLTSIVASGSRLYAGGSFRNIGGRVQSSVASLDLATGAADPAFTVTDLGNVFRLALGDNNLYVDGQYSTIDGVSRPSFAAVDPATGALRTAFNPPSGFAGNAYAIATVPGSVFLGNTQDGAAAFSASDGSRTGGFAPNFNTYADVAALTVAGSQLVAGGTFQTAGGHVHNNLVALDPSTGADDPSFHPSTAGGPSNNGEIDALASTGTELYAAGQFTTVNGLPASHVVAFGTGAAAGAPVNSAPPAISGAAQEFQTLTATPGAWTNSPTAYAYQWRQCDQNGFSCTDIQSATASSYSPTPEDIGNTLVVRVTAKNASGASQPAVSGHSGVITTASAVNAPAVTTSAPSQVTANTANPNATVNGQGQNTTYWFVYGTDGVTFPYSTPRYSIGTATGDQAVTGQLNGLQPSTVYYYKVIAQNASGTASGANQSFATQASSTPAGPTPIATTGTAGAVTASGATPTGSVNPEGAQTSYYFQYGPDSGYGQVTPQYAAGSDSAAHPAPASLGGLSPLTTYYYRIVAVSSAGPVTYGGSRSFTTSAPGGSGAPPTATTGSATTSQTGASLMGSVNPGGQETHYHFVYGTDQNYGITTPDYAAGAGTTLGTVSPVGITGLSPNTTYHYAIVATSAGGTVTGADQTLTTLGNPDVSTGSATADSRGNITFTGTVDPHGLPVDTAFEYAAGDNEFYVTMCSIGSLNRAEGGTQCSFGEDSHGTTADNYPHRVAGPHVDGAGAHTVSATGSGLMPNTKIYFRLVAINGDGSTTDGLGATTTVPDSTAVARTLPPSVPTAPCGALLCVAQVQLRGVLNATGKPVTYHFTYTLTNSCSQATSTHDTPDQTLAGGSYTDVTASASLSVAGGTIVSYHLVVQDGTNVISGAPQTYLAPAGGDSLSVENVTSTTADLIAFGAPGGALSSGAVRPLLVDFSYSADGRYGTRQTGDPVQGVGYQSWSGACGSPFSAHLTGLTPGTTYRFTAESGTIEVHDYAYGSYLKFIRAAALPEQSFVTAATTVAPTAHVLAPGTVATTVTCATAQPCTGRIQLSVGVVGLAAVRRIASRTIILGTERFRISSRSTKLLTIHLSPAGRRYLRRHSILFVTETASVRAGRGPMTVSRTTVRLVGQAHGRRGRLGARRGP